MQPSLDLKYTIYTLEQLIEFETNFPYAPQLALAGRSNVGKSSLINALANRKDLAKISSSPGKTRSLNFYQVSPEDYYLVDLPGYGYARCSKSERQKWAKLINAYISKNQGLQAVVLLLDCRIPPQDLDMELASFMQASGMPILPVLTKIDKCNQRERSTRENEWKIILGVERLFMVSAKTGLGVNKLWEAMRNVVLGLSHEG